MTAPLVRCDRLVVGFGRRALLPPIDLAIDPGEVLLIVGHNGAGKTTLVRTLLGLLRPLGGQVVRRAGLRCTYVPQATSIDPLVPLQVDELLRWGAQRRWSFLAPWRRPRLRAEAGAGGGEGGEGGGAAGGDGGGAALAGIAELRRRRFGELSGGQRQRALLARLLAGDAELAVLDEPTASMDGVATESTFAALRRLATERGATSIVVSHAADAARYVDRIALVDPGEPPGSGEPGAPGGGGGAGLAIGAPAEIEALPRFRALFGGARG